jgi:hypothetical protein
LSQNREALQIFGSPNVGALYNLQLGAGLLSRKQMLKIRRTANGEVVFTVTGRMDSESIAELERLFRSEANRHVVLDLKDLTLANQDAINFLERCEAGGITLKNCPAYIREWMMSQKSTLATPVRVRRNNSDKPKD